MDFSKGGFVRYSVQFERYPLNLDTLIGTAIVLTDKFCEEFPVSTSLGYIFYRYSASMDNHYPVDFWFCVLNAENADAAYDEAITVLMNTSNLERPFPRDCNIIKEGEMPLEI